MGQRAHRILARAVRVVQIDKESKGMIKSRQPIHVESHLANAQVVLYMWNVPRIHLNDRYKAEICTK